MSSPSSISSPSSSPASVRTRSRPSTISMNLPIEEESAAVLEYLGFEPSTASQIFQRYANRPDPDQCPDHLLDYAWAHIAVLKTDSYGDLDIQEAMARVGLTPQIQSAIADPAFSDMLWTRDLHFWVKDTIGTNYATLRSRQELLKRHAQGLVPPGEGPAPEAPEPNAISATISVRTQDTTRPPAVSAP
ncbi:hypothetical protein IFM47457_01076 [Aspergillus lentulus]|nr:hypothetical protein IFM47457_01076 [Aspergillus lentulus]